MQDEATLERTDHAHAEKDGGGVITKAVLGAAAGTVGTVLLDRVDWLMWDNEDAAARERTTAVRPGGEPPANVMVSKIEELTGAELSEERHGRAGFLTHMAIGIAPAVGYALVRDKLPGKGVPRGLLYGLGMFLMQDELMNTASGLGAKPKDYPWQAHARGLVAHLVYGVSTELTLNALERSMERTSDLGKRH